MFNRKQLVNYLNETSSFRNVNCGVPQGSILGPLLFLLIFNDIYIALNKARLIKFADDTVIYYADHNFDVIENTLNNELESISNFLQENELIINLKVGKTESMLFGTPKKLKQHHHLNLEFRNQNVNSTNRYTYLGTYTDPSLNLNDNFSRKYKKNRLRLLSTLRNNMTLKAAKDVYNMMVVPLLTFNTITNLSLNKTELDRLKSIDRRAIEIINRNSNHNSTLRSTIDSMKSQACIIVRKCLDKNICSNFHNYFTINNTPVETRNCGILTKIPKIKLELARHGFYFTGSTIYNSLPRDIREEKVFAIFKEKVGKHCFGDGGH